MCKIKLHSMKHEVSTETYGGFAWSQPVYQTLCTSLHTKYSLQCPPQELCMSLRGQKIHLNYQ